MWISTLSSKYGSVTTDLSINHGMRRNTQANINYIYYINA